MKNSVLIITGLLIAVVAGAVGFLFQQHINKPQWAQVVIGNRADDPVKSLIGTTRPGFALQDMEGQQRNVREWDDHVLVINFWATWCPPCRDEIPSFIKLQEKYAGQGLQFVGIALQTAEEVKDFVAELGMNYPVLVGTEEVIKVAEEYGNRSGVLPYTVIIDRQHQINFIKRGPLHYEQAEMAILAVL